MNKLEEYNVMVGDSVIAITKLHYGKQADIIALLNENKVAVLFRESIDIYERSNHVSYLTDRIIKDAFHYREDIVDVIHNLYNRIEILHIDNVVPEDVVSKAYVLDNKDMFLGDKIQRTTSD